MRGMKWGYFGGISVIAIAVFLSLISFSLPASAAINQQINFQGKLTNPDGTNVTDSNYSIRFRIYNHATNDATNTCSANSCLWEETQGTVAVTDGNFQVALGSVNTNLATNVSFNTAGLYLGIKVGADAEMTPRIQFTAAPYAFNSEKVGGISSAGLVQLGQSASAQTDSSTNAGVFINKTGASGNILQLQKAAVDVFTIGNTGNITATGTYNTNTFTGNALTFGAASAATIQSAASQSLNVTGHGNSVFSTDAGTLTVQGLGVTTLASANRSTGTTNSSNIVVTTGNATGATSTAGNVSIDVGTSTTSNGSILIGTAVRAQTISIGNSNAGTAIALTAGNGITLNNNTSIASGQNFTVSGGTSSLTGPGAGGSTVFTVNTSVASNTGIRINTVGSAANAFEVFSGAASAVVAAFDNAGDLFLGATGGASGAVSTPSTSTAATASSALFLNTGNSTTSGNTGSVSLQSGNATSGTSGNVNIDNGTFTAGLPQINLGTANTRDINIGNTNAATTVAVVTGVGTNVFSVQGALSAVYMQIDSTNSRLYVGNPTADGTAMLLILDTKNTAGDPTGINGGSYYNSVNSKFRCYEANYWSDCMGTRVLGQTTLGAAGATISVSLAANVEYLHCRLDVKGRSVASMPYVRFNNNTGAASYNWNAYGIVAAAVVDWQDASDSEIQLSGTQTGTNPFSADLKITNFSDTNKAVDWTAAGVEAVGTNLNRYSGTGAFYLTGSQISSVQFVASAGNFNTGSRAWCEGR